MLLKSLTLNSIRAFSREAKITFQPGMNLIVGINGVGKSTILDTVRIMLSKVLPEFTAANAKSIVLAFNSGHVTVGRQSLSATLIFHAVNIDFQYFVQQHRETYGHVSENDENLEDEIERLDRRRRIEERRLKDRSYTVENTQQLTSNPEKIPTSLKSAKSQPLVLYFSPHRSLTSMKAPKKGSGQSLAFVEAFAERELNPRAFAEWMIVQDALTAEDARKDIQQQALKQAVESFLPDCSNLRAIQEPEPTLVIDKAGKTVDIRQLSDGERSMLVLVMDLARRLSIASPNLKNPLQSEAVVLIDELDLHLHPQWQRSIVQKLTTTFPNCQFIATTHSPIIIGEVERENIILIEGNGEIIHPRQSLGMDTEWILKHLMGTHTRNLQTEEELKRIANLIQDEQYDEASQAIKVLRRQQGDFPELVRLKTRIERFQLLGE